MSVEADIDVVRLPYNGWVEPALPVGQWQAQGQLSGDASGGFSVINVIFARVQAAPNEQLYNIEQMNVRNNGTTTDRGIMNVINMWAVDGGSTTFGIPLIAADTSGGLQLDVSGLNLPIWLSSQQDNVSQAECEFVFDNVNGIVNRITMQGYVWNPRSILAEGGPQRPLGALWN